MFERGNVLNVPYKEKERIEGRKYVFHKVHFLLHKIKLSIMSLVKALLIKSLSL